MLRIASSCGWQIANKGVGTILAVLLEGKHKGDVTHSLGKEALVRYRKVNRPSLSSATPLT